MSDSMLGVVAAFAIVAGACIGGGALLYIYTTDWYIYQLTAKTRKRLHAVLYIGAGVLMAVLIVVLMLIRGVPNAN